MAPRSTLKEPSARASFNAVTPEIDESAAYAAAGTAPAAITTQRANRGRNMIFSQWRQPSAKTGDLRAAANSRREGDTRSVREVRRKLRKPSLLRYPK